MSWRDDPIVETPNARVRPPQRQPAAASHPAWMSDPVVRGPALANAAPAPRAEATGMDRAQALNAGANRGIAGILGLPVDTALNVADLAKAAAGVGYHELTGNPIPSALEGTPDRSRFVGSSEWIAARARQANDATGVDLLPVDPARPDDTASRYAFAAGAAAPNVALGRPANAVQALRGAAATVSPAVAAQTVAEVAPDNRGAQLAAAMLTQAAPTAAAAAVRRVVRGGEAGRQRVAENLRTFEAAGAGTPSVGQATERPGLQAIETLAGRTPGGYGRMREFGEQQQGGLQARVDALTDELGGNRSPGTAGATLQQGARDFRDRFREQHRELDNAALDRIPAGRRFPIPATERRLAQATNPTPGLQAAGTLMVPPHLRRLAEALKRDDALPGGSLSSPTRSETAAGAPMTTERTQGGVPFRDFRAVRADLGERAFPSNPLQITPETAQLRGTWGGMADDLQQMARDTSPEAVTALGRANRYYEAGSKRLDKLEPVQARAIPEEAFKLLERQTVENVSQVRAIKRSLTPEQWRSQVSVITDRLGKATPGNQNDVGDVFSADRFLTNWNKMDAKGKGELYSGFDGADDVRAGLDAVAKVSANLKSGSRVLANPSGTGPFVSASNVATASGAAVLTGNPTLAAVALTPVAMANVTSRLMTSPKFVRWLAGTSEVPAKRAVTYLGQLAGMANREGDPELQRDLSAYAGALGDELAAIR